MKKRLFKIIENTQLNKKKRELVEKQLINQDLIFCV